MTRKNSGFTLIEVLVTVAVTGILMTLASVIFINTVRNSKKAEITAEARQNAALVIDRLQKDARNATNLQTSANGRTLTIENAGGPPIVWDCHLPDFLPPPIANGYITRDPDASVPGGALTVTNRDPIDGVSLDNCQFEPANVSVRNFVTFRFNLTEGVGVLSGPQEYQVDIEFTTSVSTRDTN